MMRKSVAFMAAGAAALLASCVTPVRPPQAPIVTIELFDSRTAPAAARQSFPAPSEVSLPAAPEIAIPAAAVVEAVAPPVSPAPAPQPTVAAQPAALLAAIPAAPSAIDAGMTVPVRPRAKSAFALIAPVAPALVATAAVAPEPPKQKPPTTQKAVAAGPSVRPAASAAPIALPAAPATASPAPAPAPASTAASAAPSASPYGRLREIYARLGDVLQVGLDGVGFLFLGFPDARDQAEGMLFKSKENRNNKTWFTFQAMKLGTYDLDFLQQDNAAGKTARETVRVHVVTDQDFSAAVALQPAPEGAGSVPGEMPDPAFARRLTSLGSYQAAVAELLKGYKDGNPALNNEIADLYMRMGSYEAAGKYYGRNLSPQNPFTGPAVSGMVRIAAIQNDQQGLLAVLKQLLSTPDSSTEEPLIMAVRMERSRSEVGLALDLAGEYVKRFPQGAWRDEADYLSAQLLEADSPFRDIARARELYAGILSSRAESAFADAARQRLQYIDRHFFQVR
jgi:tetratricopeptide (TPR) repeat protein